MLFVCLFYGSIESFKFNYESNPLQTNCFHIVPSGSRIGNYLEDGSLSYWNYDTKKNEIIPPCINNNNINTSKDNNNNNNNDNRDIAFSILSYNVDINYYEKEIQFNSSTIVPINSPNDIGQTFHTYSTIAQPLFKNDNSSFQGIEAVLQFGDFLTGNEFYNSWSIRGWYWNSQGLNILTPGIKVNSKDNITTNMFGFNNLAIGSISSKSSGEYQYLEMEISDPITWCVTSLEMNNLSSCSGYPPNNFIYWYDTIISVDNNILNYPYEWNLKEYSPSCDLKFHTSPNGKDLIYTWNSTMPL